MGIGAVRDRKGFEAAFTEMTLAMVWGIDSEQESCTKSSIQCGMCGNNTELDFAK